MLKTNSKQVKEKIKAYLYNTFTDYEGEPAGDRTESQVLGDILEQTQEERSKYSQSEAEELMTLLISRELELYLLMAIY